MELKNKIIRFVLCIMSLVLVFTALAMVSFNTHPVVFDYFFDASYVPLSVLLVSSVLAGLVLGAPLGAWLYHQWQHQSFFSKKSAEPPEVQQHDDAIPDYAADIGAGMGFGHHINTTSADAVEAEDMFV